MGIISYNYGLMPLYIQPIFHMTAGVNPAGLWLFRFRSNHGNPFPVVRRVVAYCLPGTMKTGWRPATA